MPKVGGVDAERLRGFVSRIEKLEDEKGQLLDVIKEVYQDVKSAGYDAKIVRQIVKERGTPKEKLDEQAMLLELYRRAVGAWGGTELGKYGEAAE